MRTYIVEKCDFLKCKSHIYLILKFKIKNIVLISFAIQVTYDAET